MLEAEIKFASISLSVHVKPWFKPAKLVSCVALLLCSNFDVAYTCFVWQTLDIKCHVVLVHNPELHFEI